MRLSAQQVEELRQAFARLRPTVTTIGNTVSINDRKAGNISITVSPVVSPTYNQIRG